MVPPLAKSDVKMEPNPEVIERPLIVRAEFPLFEIVKLRSLLWPTVTLPKARLPLIPMIRVGVEGDGVAEGVGEVGDDEPPQAATKNRDTTTAEAIPRIEQEPPSVVMRGRIAATSTDGQHKFGSRLSKSAL
jgi:hypothetical protein